ncbi:enoyl-CoA hydratase-related protein [Siccirubricoccus sp. G192]|uniref:enoyl-CoA hydratase-related protein n=1 Tax=Siccirubricoccus sp. G192 TaxID=2849651 RepID=UPI001C2C2153|nr:enoyl-CoA hydratase-related protein [Siccirubricoccus sp. G192]MBV1798653.1 enoyl-CoA hydratase/isomerase family protein [Siccirubricoccus sp. G192]
MSEHIRVAVAEGVCTVTIDRAEKKNSLTRAMYAGLADAVEMAAREDAVRCLLLTGSGDVFCAGNDIGEFRNRPADDGPPPSKRFYFGLANFEKPVVAAVPGLAIGIGCTMLMHADIIYAAPEARFRLPFVDLGVVPELGSSLLLPWLAGHHRASELMLLGEFFDAATAKEIGLVNRLVPLPELLPNATATAAALARKPAEALRLTKSLLRRDRPALLARMEEERVIFARQLASPETQAIMAGVLKPKA